MRKFLRARRWKWKGLSLISRHAIILAVLGVLLAGSALGSQLFGVFAQGPCKSGDQVYTVVSGDTLSGIAVGYNTAWWRLASYNHLSNANLIFPGQSLCIPSSGQGAGTPPSTSQYVALARRDALAAGLPPDTFVRQINQESGFNPNAISPAGAIGIAQFEPATAAGLGINPYDPVASLTGAAQLMAHYTQQYADYAKALAAYNAGPGALQTAIMLGGTGWRLFLPAETQNYIRIILG